MFFDSFPYWDKQEVPSLYFNLLSLNMKPNADSVKVGGREWRETMHISGTKKEYKQTYKNKNG